MISQLRVHETSPSHWKYISEGGSTIVFSYTGPSNPSYNGTALRLRKAPLPANEDPDRYQKPTLAREPTEKGDEEPSGKQQEGISRSEAEERYEDSKNDSKHPDDPTVVFQRAVISRLVPPEYLPRLESVHVEKQWLEQLAQLVEPLRPLERRAKDRIDTARRKAVLATDLVGGEGWSVEIKPKWGFLPSPTYLSPETRDIKLRTCRFCMHAHLKSTQGEDVALGYCPLDLYSGDEDRMQKALGALWDVWVGSGGAVNNLHVFVHGKMLKPTVDIRTAFIRTVQPILRSPVLSRLSHLQRRLDALDIEGLAALWAHVRGPGVPFGAELADPDISEWERFVEAYAARERDIGEDADAKRGDLSTSTLEERAPPTEAELRFRVIAYLLAAAFKDCSVIVRLRPQLTEGGVVRQDATVTMIDLDVKGVDRLRKWAKLDREIVEAYRGVEPRNCVDSH
ncbi:inositol-pentakisphosphate 2-kinase [Pilatotrama ljubarskyi]|nr:inositol-pentakisphosphate 2-kinase [Pilatotrama ljubarskyi]